MIEIKDNKLNQLITNFKRDQSGSLGVVFGASALTIMIAVGTTYDINQVQSSSVRAQQVADIVGLSATVHVKNFGEPPATDEEGYMHGKTYSAKEEGFNVGAATKGSNDITFKVLYDKDRGEAVVKMNGSIQTSFMGAFGQESIAFNTESTVKYAQSDNGDPASIFLVLDNSGSMAWSDKQITERKRVRVRSGRRYFWQWQYVAAGSKPRIDGLKTEVKKFNDYLQETVEEKTNGESDQFLRMGMSVYASGLINSRTVTPRWGALPNNTINRLAASGGTYPDSAMSQTESWINLEDNIHKTVNGSEDPLKYVIFMTDGVNSSSTTESRTLSSCTRLKNKGVTVYTIGFALEPGDYIGYYNTQYARLSQASSNKAYNFLRSCASSTDHFVKAENTDALNEAFDKIGKDIVQDVIRVAS